MRRSPNSKRSRTVLDQRRRFSSTCTISTGDKGTHMILEISIRALAAVGSVILLGSPAIAQTTLRLEDLEQMALRKNPTLQQATAAVKTAQALRTQSGLYPNPV